MRPPGDDPSTHSGGVSRLYKAVLVAYLGVVSSYVIFVVVTEGFGKSLVGSLLALIVGVILCLRVVRESNTFD